MLINFLKRKFAKDKRDLPRATVAELTYYAMKTKIKAIYDYCAKSKASSEETSDIQVEAFLIENMAHKAAVEDGVAAVEEQDLLVEQIITVTRTMNNHAKTDLVLMASLQNVLSVNPYFIMQETVLTTRNLLSRNILFCSVLYQGNRIMFPQTGCI